MIAGVAFNLYEPRWSVAETAARTGMTRVVLDNLLTRYLAVASGREPAVTPPRATSGRRGKQKRVARGHPTFSFRDLLYLRTMRTFAELGVSLREAANMAEEAKKRTMNTSEAALDVTVGLATASDAALRKGEWMWAMARSMREGNRFEYTLTPSAFRENGILTCTSKAPG